MNINLKRFREEMKRRRMKGAFISSPLNVKYLTGFEGAYPSEVLVGYFFNPDGFLFVTDKRVVLLVDSRYEGSAKKVRGVEVHILSSLKRAEEIAGLISKSTPKGSKIGIEKRFLTYEDGTALLGKLKGRPIEDISNVLAVQRAIKSPEEIAALKEAVRVTDQAFSFVLPKIKPGMRERDIAYLIEQFFRERGMGLSFKIIVASGPNSSIPHHLTGDRKLKKGDTVILDFGALNKGYHGDMTRTIFIGKPNKRQREIYSLVCGANKACEAWLKPGITASEVDAVARSYLGEHSKYFTHSLGHGVGLVIHEEPKLHRRSTDILSPGMVFSIEPGVYIPRWGGVRVEDLVLMTEKAAHVLSRSSKDLIYV